MPDIPIKNVEHFNSSTVKISDFRGKWLILDFWHKYCKGCFLAMPHTDSMQRKFADQVQFLLIGREDKENKIRAAYAKFQKAYNLDLAVAYDSTAHNRLGVSSCPVIMVIDPDGIVRGKSYALETNQLQAFVSGQIPELASLDGEALYSLNDSLPLQINNNGGRDTAFLYRSLLSKGSNDVESRRYVNMSIPLKEYGLFQVTNVALVDLYFYAYLDQCQITYYDSLYGKMYPKPILEMKDSSLFSYSYTGSKNLYSYALNCPKKKRNWKDAGAIMQRDLMNYFGYDVSFQKRVMPYYRLTSTPQAKQRLTTKGGKQTWTTNESESTSLVLRNYPSSAITFEIFNFHQFDIPFIDETGLQDNVDITLNALFSDLESVKQALRQQGLNLTIGYKEFDVMIIGDYRNEKSSTTMR